MNSGLRFLFLLIPGLLLALLAENACAQLEQLATRVPSSANALVVVNVKQVLSSPLARQGQWQQEGGQAHRSGMVTLPYGAEWFLMAAEFDYEFMEPLWEVAVAHLKSVPNMKDVAERSGGRLDRLGGSQAVERPNDSYVVALGPRTVGAMSPANRQQVTRWVRESSRKKSPDMSDYLSQALAATNDKANHIVMAMDLQGVLALPEVEAALAKQDALKDSNADPQELAKVVAGIEGMRLEIEFKARPRGRLRVDFSADVSILADVAKPLLLEVLANHGASVQDLENWKASTVENSIVLEGALTADGLRRLLSVLSGPVGPMSSSGSEGEAESGSEAVAAATQKYFQSVTNYLNDLFFGDKQPQSMHQISVWVERYARKIEDLDDHQVDPDAVAFGADAVDALHEIVSIIDRSEKRSDIREATMMDSGRRRYGRYGAYGWFEKGYVTRDRQVIQADEASRGVEGSQAIVDELKARSAETRQTLTDRYDREF